MDIDTKATAAEIAAALRALLNRYIEKVRNVRRDYTKRLAKIDAATMVELAKILLDEYSERFVAYELLLYHRPALRSLGAAELEHLGRGIDSWDKVDTFATYLSGPAWREKQVSDELIHQWACSDDRWWRRAALVSTVPLNLKARGGKGDTARTLAVCRLLVNDHDDMIVKAMSWALRALIVHDAEAVRAFLAEHDKSLAARVKREVQNKLKTGLKNPRKK
jgi:3-methyladenine DNA glycosylase AlkD